MLVTDAAYDILSVADVARYVRGRAELAALVDPDTLTVREVGDGNLNLVFVCRDDHGRSLVLKQSLPYVRAAGPTWPLTADRSHAEARGLRAAAEASPSTSPRLFGYDSEQHVLAMEDLSDLTVLRTALNRGGRASDAVADCGRHVARLVFHTGRLTNTPAAHRDAAARATNRAMCDITEALVFNEPFVDHANNRFVDALGPQVRALRSDVDARREVARLEQCFIDRPEALVHGDLHTGSVMVGVAADGTRVTKVIDPEFCFYGPAAFDLGTLLANVTFAATRAHCLGDDVQRRWLDTLPTELWHAFTDEFWILWPQRSTAMPSTWPSTEAQASAWLDTVARDAVGFAGCETVRRVVGFAKVSDIETLEADEHVAAATIALGTARRWLTSPASLTSSAS